VDREPLQSGQLGEPGGKNVPSGSSLRLCRMGLKMRK
jgi:hypothetical protein